jgi:hypothetical protein
MSCCLVIQEANQMHRSEALHVFHRSIRIKILCPSQTLLGEEKEVGFELRVLHLQSRHSTA